MSQSSLAITSTVPPVKSKSPKMFRKQVIREGGGREGGEDCLYLYESINTISIFKVILIYHYSPTHYYRQLSIPFFIQYMYSIHIIKNTHTISLFHFSPFLSIFPSSFFSPSFALLPSLSPLSPPSSSFLYPSSPSSLFNIVIN